jgi:hypothetical protein
MVFDPREIFGNGSQTRGAFVYGGGIDVRVARHRALRPCTKGPLVELGRVDRVAVEG